MARHLHLLREDSNPLVLPVIERQSREPGAEVTVVLLDVAAAPTLPPEVRVRRLAEGELDYAGLLDLIFDHDHVVSW